MSSRKDSMIPKEEEEKKTKKQDSTTLEIIKLHPTFAAEVRGLDFSQEISEEVFQEVLGIFAKVRLFSFLRFPCTYVK